LEYNPWNPSLGAQDSTYPSIVVPLARLLDFIGNNYPDTMESFATTIAGLEAEMADLDERIRVEMARKQQMQDAIAEFHAQQHAEEAELAEITKEIAEMECQLEDADALEACHDKDDPADEDTEMKVCALVKEAVSVMRYEASIHRCTSSHFQSLSTGRTTRCCRGTVLACSVARRMQCISTEVRLLPG
jgi:cell pole-organizing protein PopZ